MLLCLNSTEPVARKDGNLEDGSSTLVAAAGRDPRLAEEEAADAGNAAAATVSPLQALVQDIMQQQKQRAQVPTSLSQAAHMTVQCYRADTHMHYESQLDKRTTSAPMQLLLLSASCPRGIAHAASPSCTFPCYVAEVVSTQV